MSLFIQIPTFLLVFAFGILATGTALTPGLVLLLWIWKQTGNWDLWERAWVLGVAIGIAYLIYGFCLMALAILVNRAMPRLRPGAYPYLSRQGIQWFLSGVLPVIISKTFLDFLTLSGLNVLYFRLMGARIGKGVHLNTKDLGDFHMISIGDHTMIGGQAIVIGHAAERGRLILKPVKIGSGVTVGTRAIIFPGAEIGDKAVIGAGAVVRKDEKAPPGSVYVGVPARNIRERTEAESENVRAD